MVALPPLLLDIPEMSREVVKLDTVIFFSVKIALFVASIPKPDVLPVTVNPLPSKVILSADTVKHVPLDSIFAVKL